ncbi:MAG: peroxiredoxin [bacterium]
MTLSEKDKAPDFSAKDQQGKVRSLSDYRGKWLLLYFYPKDDTFFCTKEACGFRDSFAELKGKVEVLGVSRDSVESHAKFAGKFALPYPLLSDADKKIIKAYGANGFLFTKRISYLIDPQGKIAKVYPSVSASSHAREVLKDFEALQS